ncbi:uncharacterized protein YjiS (DUF1127 family) [Pseudomonas sp. JUb42]|jgi:uncharacterized protein YjiS (DUF1127 family)|nr:DUF1127 domain-containing protein [Pseudomonas sp. JUb42]MCS3466897.1 uncharacterized protein YjiS (DUF1127 family) [Pseudomonas sp. JUb42]
MMKGQKGYVLVVKTLPRELSVERLIKSIAGHARRWYELHRQRQLLAGLDDCALKDLGLSRADIQSESERPFWDDPMKR